MRMLAAAALAAGLLMAAVGLSIAGDEAQEKAVKKELKKLEGVWRIVSMEVDGEKMPEEQVKKFKLILKGHNYTFKSEDEVVGEGTYKIDPTKKPKTADIMPTKGADEGKIWLSIYELEGDTMKECRAPAGKDRPTKFSAKSGTGHTLVVYKRAQAE